MVVKVNISSDRDRVVLARPNENVDIEILKEGSCKQEVEITHDIDGFIDKMKRQRNLPQAQYAYHAFMNPQYDWTIERVEMLLDYADDHNLEVRAWSNLESGLILIVVKDPDMSEDSGWELYQMMQPYIESYGLASWYEWENYGVELPTDKEIKEGNLGTILVGEGDEWVILDLR
jgi:hypothetical protein